MTEYNWDDVNTGGGTFVKFQNIGDGVVGTINKVYNDADFNGNPIPYLDLDTDDGDKTVAASQVMLRQALAENRPQAGDKISIKYTADGDAKPGRAPAKLFEVKVKAGERPAATISGDDDPDPF